MFFLSVVDFVVIELTSADIASIDVAGAKGYGFKAKILQRVLVTAALGAAGVGLCQFLGVNMVGLLKI